ncbi:MAG: hypothetical protein U0V74_04770 [Chitinophagales bacterium]
MKKIFASAFLIMAFAAMSFGQQAYNLYKLSGGAAEADLVLKAMNIELKLTDAEFPKVKELITASARSQQELFTKPESKNPETATLIVQRQTTHIESNLKNILGEDRYKKYLEVKPAIEAKAKELGKN